MRKFLWGGAAALALAFVCLTPNTSQASWLSEALHPRVVVPVYGSYYNYPDYYGPTYSYPSYYGGVYSYPRYHHWYGPNHRTWYHHGNVNHHGGWHGGHHHR